MKTVNFKIVVSSASEVILRKIYDESYLKAEMLTENSFQIVISLNLTHYLGQRHSGINFSPFEPDRKNVCDHFNQQGYIEPVIVQPHIFHSEHGLEDFPEIFNNVVLLLYMPYFCTAHECFAEINQEKAACLTASEKEEHKSAECGADSLNSFEKHVNTPSACLIFNALLQFGSFILFTVYISSFQ